MRTDIPTFAIVIPCYNEEQIIKESSEKLLEILNNLISEKKISPESYICVVDDGSTDKTPEILQDMMANTKQIKMIRFACNFGHQKAIMCGMVENDADIYITIDCDLQDDINVIPQMVETYLTKDVEVVYGVRNDRSTDSFMKRITADAYYKIMEQMGVKEIPNCADFRLVSKKVVDVLRNYKENDIYLRGLIYSLGFRYEKIYYKRLERIGGTAKYNFTRMINLASAGITSSTSTPIRIILFLGVLVILAGILKTSSTTLIGGLNLFAIGVVGEYISKINIEVKNRPNWIIKEKKNY